MSLHLSRTRVATTTGLTRPDQLGEAVLQIHAGGDLRSGARGRDLPGDDDGHVSAEALDGRHDVAGDDDGTAIGGEVGQDRLDGPGGHRIHPLEGLVQNEVDLLAHASGVVGDECAAGAVEIQDVKELGRTRNDDIAPQTAEQPGIGDQLHPGESIEGAQAVWQDAELRLGGGLLVPYVETVNDGAAGIGYEQARGHGQGRGLARSVRTHHAVDGAGRDVQGKRVDGDFLTEGLAQPVQRQCRSRCLRNSDGRW